MIFRKAENRLYDHMGIVIRPIEVVSLFWILKIESTRRCMGPCVCTSLSVRYPVRAHSFHALHARLRISQT